MIVRSIAAGSLAARCGFEVGDRLVSVNGTAVRDPIDLQVAGAEDHLLFAVERGGETYEVEVTRRAGEILGLDFDEMRLRRCNNRCVFCFLHQMPRGLRRSLYFEDDDYRLSFLHGSYVTLTNVKEADLRRIIDQRLTPQYISVHATEPVVRQRLLGRKGATVPILERIDLLAAHGIEMHAQVVICPGWNDGTHLERTVFDLQQRYPAVRSVALVPVGLTRFRQHLPDLERVDADRACRYVGQAEAWGAAFVAALGERFVYPGDELFLLAGRPLPPASYYDAFPQIENGIGMVRTFLDRWLQGDGACLSSAVPRRLILVTGRLAHTFLEPLVAGFEDPSGLRLEVVAVDNDFFGRGITVSGLLAAQDVIAALRTGPAGGGAWDLAILPPNMFNVEGLTLDDATVGDIEADAGLPVTVGDYDLAATLRRSLTVEANARRRQGEGRQLSELGVAVGRVS